MALTDQQRLALQHRIGPKALNQFLDDVTEAGGDAHDAFEILAVMAGIFVAKHATPGKLTEALAAFNDITIDAAHHTAAIDAARAKRH